jgi:hypothetical protein
MTQSKFLIAGLVAGAGLLFAAPSITRATPLTPIAFPSLTTVHSSAIDQVRYYKRRWGGRHWGWRAHRRGHWARCWHCGRRWRHAYPYYFSFGVPVLPYAYGYPSYGYPYYGYYGSSVYFGGKQN